MLPLQQPLGQLDAVQVHTPFTHAWVGAHAAQVAPLVPHELFVWLPVGVQVLVVPSQHPVHVAGSQTQTPLEHFWPAAQATQVEPTAPQAELVSLPSGTQVLLLQQPVVQLAEVQTQVPFVVLQVVPVEHAAQAAPPAPHWPFDSLP